MALIDNDKVLRAQLKAFNSTELRQLGAQFVESILAFNDDPRISRAVEVGKNPDVSEEELESVYKAARAATVESRTRCGADCNWDEQAAHFVARAVAAVVAPKGKCKATDPPWQVVMSCRMAKNCALIASDGDAVNTESETQYQIINDFIQSK